MSERGRTCTYQARREEPETWHGNDPDEWVSILDRETDDGIWDCPHEALDGYDRCVFHLSPEEVPDEVDESEHFVRAINEDSVAAHGERARRKREFIGATFSELCVADTIVADDGNPIVLANSCFEGNLEFVGEQVEPQLYAPNSTCMSECVLAAIFVEGVYFYNSTFNDVVHASDQIFSGETSFTNSVFNDKAYFITATFDEVYFTDAIFNDDGIFRGATFNHAYFSAVFNNEALFSSAVFENGGTFSNAVFNDWSGFRNVTFGSEADFSGTTFDEMVDFSSTTFNGGDFSEVVFNDDGNFTQVDLTEVNFTGATLTNTNLENSLLNRATLVGADFRGAALDGVVLGDARIDGSTRFLGTPDQEDKIVDEKAPSQEIESSDENLSDQEDDTGDAKLSPVGNYCVYDHRYDSGSGEFSDSDSAVISWTKNHFPLGWMGSGTKNTNHDDDLDSAQSTYRALETLAGANARPQLQSRCFVNRQDIQLERYRRAMRSASSRQQKLRFGRHWLYARISRAIFLYGESPWRVTGWLFTSILGFTLLYPVGGWVHNTQGQAVTYSWEAIPSVIGNSLYFSVVTFTSLGSGNFQPHGFGRSLAAIETVLGAVLIALLVFVLGRRAAR